MKNRVYAYFTICGSFEPEQITKRLKIHPSKVWKKGDTYRNQVRNFSRWNLDSRLDKRDALEAHVGDVLDQMDQNATEFHKISSEFAGVMQLVGVFENGYPGLHFEASLIERLARYKLKLDFDFYPPDSST